MLEEFKYVYGIVGRGCSTGLCIKGMEGKPTYEIEFKDIAAVASDASKLEFELTEKNGTLHQKVLGRLIKKTTVIPMAFNMVFKNKEVVVGFLENSYATTKDLLQRFDGKVELGVKAIAPGGAASVPKLRDEFKNNVIKALSPHAVSVAEGSLFSDRLLVALTFLVEKKRVELFSQAIENLEKKFAPVKISYSGPWPPYSFLKFRAGE